MGRERRDLRASMMKSRILVAAGDAPLRATLARWLMAAGYAVELAESPKRAREVVANEAVALAIVAPDRLGPAGAELARELGSQIEQLIVIAERADEAGRPAGPAIQADGYLSEPLNEQDVLARVKAALGLEPIGEELTGLQQTGPQVLRFEGYTLDASGRTCLRADGEEVPLTRAEFSLLLALGRQPGRVLSRDELRHVVAGRGAEPDDRSVDVLISRLRRKIEPDPKAPRIIVTVPGEGYKFTVKPQAAFPIAEAPTLLAVAPIAEAKQTNALETTAAALSPHRRRSVGAFRTAVIAATAAALTCAASLVIAFWYPGYATKVAPKPAASAPKFDAAVIPLVNDAVRAFLADYPAQPNFKAVAISVGGWGQAFGALDLESAKREALDRCVERSKFSKICKIYAAGTDVVWPTESLPLPMPADIHIEPLDVPLVADEIPTLDDAGRRTIAEQYVNAGGYRASRSVFSPAARPLAARLSAGF